MRRAPAWPRHAIMVVVSVLMLIPFYWVVKTSLTGENIYVYPPRIVPVDPHLFHYVDVWYLIPFPRYLLNKSLNLVVMLRRPRDDERLLAVVQVPAVLPRFVPLASDKGHVFTSLEAVIRLLPWGQSSGYCPRACACS